MTDVWTKRLVRSCYTFVIQAYAFENNEELYQYMWYGPIMHYAPNQANHGECWYINSDWCTTLNGEAQNCSKYGGWSFPVGITQLVYKSFLDVLPEEKLEELLRDKCSSHLECAHGVTARRTGYKYIAFKDEKWRSGCHRSAYKWNEGYVSEAMRFAYLTGNRTSKDQLRDAKGLEAKAVKRRAQLEADKDSYKGKNKKLNKKQTVKEKEVKEDDEDEEIMNDLPCRCKINSNRSTCICFN